MNEWRAYYKVKVSRFGRVAFSYSDVQPPFDIKFPWSSGLPGETISLPVLCAANIRLTGISNLHRNRPLRVPIHTQVKLSLGESILVPREIHVRSVRIQTRDLSIFLTPMYVDNQIYNNHIFGIVKKMLCLYDRLYNNIKLNINNIYFTEQFQQRI